MSSSEWHRFKTESQNLTRSSVVEKFSNQYVKFQEEINYGFYKELSY